MIYVQKVLHHDVLFVNLNAARNQNYITQYHLQSVPTIVVGDRQYSGTDVKKIKTLLHDAPKIFNQEV